MRNARRSSVSRPDEEREQFIEQFWLRRDPTPDTEENEFKEEHYRRIAYANEHYASGIPGWKTDRGRIYIIYGPADEIESHPSGGTYERPMEEGGGDTLDLSVRAVALPLHRGHWQRTSSSSSSTPPCRANTT